MSPAKDDGLACAVSSVPEIIMNGGDDKFSPLINRPRNFKPDEEAAKTTTITSDGETFGEILPMPVGLNYHCAVALEGGDLFVTGGDTRPLVPGVNNGTTFLYHADTTEWEALPDMPTPRVGLQCARVLNEAGEQEVIAAGGFYENVVEIFNIPSRQWRTGKSNCTSAYSDNAIFQAL